MANGVKGWFEDFIPDLDAFLEAIGNKITDALQLAIDKVFAPIGRMLEKPVDALVSAAQGAGDVLRGIGSSVIRRIDQVLRSLSSVPEALGNTITSAMDAAIGGITDVATSIQKNVVSGLDDVINSVVGVVDGIISTVSEGIDNTINSVAALVEDIPSRIASGITDGVEVVLRLSTDLMSRASEAISQSLSVAGDALADIASKVVGGFDTLKEAMSKQLGNFWGFSWTDDRDQVMELIDPLLREVENDEDFIPELKDALAPGFPFAAFLLPIAVGATVGPLLSGAVNAKFASKIEKMRQGSMLQGRPALLPPSDAMEALRRFPLLEEHVDEQLGRFGYSVANIELFKRNRFTLLNANDWLVMWRRKEINDAQLEVELSQLGYDGEEQEALRKLAFPIPPLADIIRMAVREVFSPEIAEAFGQFDELPPDYMKWAEVAGLTPEWARNIWAAHWILPSIQQGFEMLHRRVIDQPTLDKLMVALDVMPGWRDRLTQISFRPLTRVDVRRMHKLGVLSEQEVFDAYLDFGYNDVNAKRMMEFTVLFNTPKETVDEKETRDLTKTEILLFLEESLFTEEETLDSLFAIGYSEFAANALVQVRMVEVGIQERKQDIAVVEALLKNDDITFNEAMERLDGLGLPDLQRNSLLAKFGRETQVKVRFPSIGQLNDMVEQNTITEVIYRNGLLHLGYSNKWADRLMLAQGRKEGIDSLSTSEIEGRVKVSNDADINRGS